MQTRFEAFAFIDKCTSVREPVDQELDTMSAWCGSRARARACGELRVPEIGWVLLFGRLRSSGAIA